MPDSKRGVQSGREVLDSTALEAIRSLQSDSAPRLLAQVIQIYLDSTPALIEQLRTAIRNSDHDAIRAAAHSLKSSSANLGANTFANLCRSVEMAARDGSMGPDVPAINEVEHEYAAVRHALEAELEAKG